MPLDISITGAGPTDAGAARSWGVDLDDVLTAHDARCFLAEQDGHCVGAAVVENLGRITLTHLDAVSDDIAETLVNRCITWAGPGLDLWRGDGPGVRYPHEFFAAIGFAQAQSGWVRPCATAPAIVINLAAGRAVKPVWINRQGTITYDIGQDEFVKIGPLHTDFCPETITQRLEWLTHYVTVPLPLGYGHDGAHVWLHTLGVPGFSAIEDRFGHSSAIIAELGRSLRHFHDVLPVAQCPWLCEDAQSLPRQFTPDLVVCHGDAANPNWVFNAQGEGIGAIDVGACGVGDRWYDLADAIRSLTRNFEAVPNRTQIFLDAYGIELDEAKLEYFSS
ncbi:MAG: phosphotransferase [Propionibacteriaceae bacterium]